MLLLLLPSAFAQRETLPCLSASLLRWVAAHGLRMKNFKCQDTECFVRAHAEACAPPAAAA